MFWQNRQHVYIELVSMAKLDTHRPQEAPCEASVCATTKKRAFVHASDHRVCPRRQAALRLFSSVWPPPSSGYVHRPRKVSIRGYLSWLTTRLSLNRVSSFVSGGFAEVLFLGYLRIRDCDRQELVRKTRCVVSPCWRPCGVLRVVCGALREMRCGRKPHGFFSTELWIGRGRGLQRELTN